MRRLDFFWRSYVLCLLAQSLFSLGQRMLPEVSPPQCMRAPIGETISIILITGFSHELPSIYKNSGCPFKVMCVLCRYPTQPCHLVNSGLFSWWKLLLARWLIDFLAGRVDKPHNMSSIPATGVYQNHSYNWDRMKEA